MQSEGRVFRLDDDRLTVHLKPNLGLVRGSDQLGRRSQTHDPAGLDHRDPVCELLRLVEIVGRQENRLPERSERPDQIPRCSSCGRIKTGRRLIEEEEIGIADERDAEVETAFLPTRERLHARVPLLLEAYELNHLVDVSGVLVVSGEKAVHLAHGQVRRELGLLEHDADPLAKSPRSCGGIVAEHRDLAGVARAVALEDLDRRRLSGAVRAE